MSSRELVVSMQSKTGDVKQFQGSALVGRYVAGAVVVSFGRV